MNIVLQECHVRKNKLPKVLFTEGKSQIRREIFRSKQQEIFKAYSKLQENTHQSLIIISPVTCTK